MSIKKQLLIAGLVAGSSLATYFIGQYKQKSNKYRKQIQELEEQILKEQNEGQKLYSTQTLLSIKSLIMEMNQEEYKKITEKNRKNRRPYQQKNVQTYLQYVVQYSSEYQKLIDESELLFKQSKILNVEVYNQSLQELEKNKNQKLAFHTSLANKYVNLRSSIPSKLESFSEEYALNTLNYMIGVVKGQYFNLGDILKALSQSKEISYTNIFGILTTILYDYVNQSDQLQGVEEEDILRQILSDQVVNNKLKQQQDLFHQCIFQLVDYVMEMKD